MRFVFLLVLFGLSTNALTQASKSDSSRTVLPELKWKLNPSGSNYLKATFLAQTWARYSELNPGSTVDGFDAGSSRSDIGIRRVRIQAYGQLTDKIFFYTQFGQNNFSFMQPRHTGAFFHDIVTEYKVVSQLQIGGGLTGWGGMSRFSAPAVASILGLDAPLYQQATNGVNDQFVRKLSVYAKGEFGKLQYRVAVSNPLTTKNSLVAIPAINSVSNFNVEPPKLQTSGYLVWQFMDKESMVVPYLPGTYYGKKKVVNIGAGWVDQKDAMWHLNEAGDTTRSRMTLLGLDVFAEFPLSEAGNTFSAYAAVNHFDFGPNYIRMLGVMNPTNGVNSSSTLNGSGVAFPMIGTGEIVYAQIAYKLKDNLFKNNGTLQFYGASQFGQFEALSDPAVMLECAVNWLIHGNGFGKVSLGLQNRPIFELTSGSQANEASRKNMLILQYQISL